MSGRGQPPVSLETMIEEIVRRVVREEIASALRHKPDTLITIAEFARARSISVSTVRNAIAENRLAKVKIGRSVRIRSDAQIASRPKAEAPADGAAVALRAIRGGKS